MLGKKFENKGENFASFMPHTFKKPMRLVIIGRKLPNGAIFCQHGIFHKNLSQMSRQAAIQRVKESITPPWRIVLDKDQEPRIRCAARRI